MALSDFLVLQSEFGEADGSELLPIAGLYLLDGNLTVLSQYTDGADVEIGSRFFDTYIAAREERDALAQHLCRHGGDNFLMMCRSTPVLFFCGLFLKTGLLLAVIPTGEIAQTLRAPSAFVGVLGDLVLSRGALAQYKTHTPEDFARVCEWYLTVCRTLSHKGAVGVGEVDAAVLGRRASQLAKLTGTRIEFDFRGLGRYSDDTQELTWFTGVVLAALMAARRLCSHKTLYLTAGREYPGGSALRLYLHRDDENARVPEFSPLLALAKIRAVPFELLEDERERQVLQLYTYICTVELSAQGVKESHHLMDDSVPPIGVQHEIPPSVTEKTELLFDEQLPTE